MASETLTLIFSLFVFLKLQTNRRILTRRADRKREQCFIAVSSRSSKQTFEGHLHRFESQGKNDGNECSLRVIKRHLRI